MTASAKNILLVDDEERLLNSIAQRISLLGFTPIKATSGIKAIEIARQTRIDLAIVDLKMPEMDGLVTITKLKEIYPDLKTVLLTGYGSEKTRQATEALDATYIEKDSMGRLWELIKQSQTDGNVMVIRPSAGIKEQSPFTDALRPLPKIIGETPGMQRLKKNIARLSELDCAIILHGETGTGKELTARTIHSLSDRKNQRFIAFDCGCFSRDFSFAELVSSFEETTAGTVSKTNEAPVDNTFFSGTILLDHIENMPEQTQKEMMHLLDQKPTELSSEPTDTAMDIRFMIAVKQNLLETGKNKDFLKALYHRIKAIKLEIPPLRERRDDLAMLCRYFIDQFNREFNKNITAVSKAVQDIFDSYSFPGNIIELRYIIERAVILSQTDTITVSHLPERLRQKDEPPVVHEPVDEHSFPTLQTMEHRHILKALEITKGNKSKAAELLGISRGALWRKLRIISGTS